MKRRLAAASCISRQSYNSVWISDVLLTETFNRFCHPKRYGSSVPGPLEAQRRAAKRKNTNLAYTGSGGASVDPSVIFGRSATQHDWWRAPRDVAAVPGRHHLQGVNEATLLTVTQLLRPDSCHHGSHSQAQRSRPRQIQPSTGPYRYHHCRRNPLSHTQQTCPTARLWPRSRNGLRKRSSDPVKMRTLAAQYSTIFWEGTSKIIACGPWRPISAIRHFIHQAHHSYWRWSVPWSVASGTLPPGGFFVDPYALLPSLVSSALKMLGV